MSEPSSAEATPPQTQCAVCKVPTAILKGAVELDDVANVCDYCHSVFCHVHDYKLGGECDDDRCDRDAWICCDCVHLFCVKCEDRRCRGHECRGESYCTCIDLGSDDNGDDEDDNGDDE